VFECSLGGPFEKDFFFEVLFIFYLLKNRSRNLKGCKFLQRHVYFVVLREFMEGLMPPGVHVKNRVWKD